MTNIGAPTEVRDEQRDESPLQRLDRNTVELLNELRVAGTGIQVLFAFLLVVQQRLQPALVLRPLRLLRDAALHRDRGGVADRPFLSVGLTGILVLISDVIWGGITAGVVGSVAAVGVVGLWFGLPLRQLRRSERQAR